MRRLAAFALPYCAAVFLAQYVLPRPLWLPAGALCALLALCALPLRGDGRLRALLIAFGLAAGFLWCRGYDAYFYSPAEELDGRTVILEAVATDWAEPAAYGYSVPVRIVLEGQPDVGALLYAGQAAAQLRPGDRVSVVAACRLAGRTASGQETAYYTSRGIFLTAAAYGEMTITSPTRIPVRYWPRLAARALRESAGRVFPADTAGFMTALILGEKAGLDDSLYAALRRTGLAHTVAVSGMHISFLAGLIGLVPGARRRRSRAAACMAGVFFYAAVTGGNPSVLRAAFQCACLQLAPLLGREEDTPTALSAVLALLLLQNPRAVTGIGLQMSFAAVAGIYLFSPRLYESWIGRLPRKGRQLPPVRALLGVLAATLGAMSFTIPISAYYFGTVSLIAPLSNLLAWPAVMAAFAAG
jgi:competence protein ComEC